MFLCRVLLLVLSTQGLLATANTSPLATENPCPLATENPGPLTTEYPGPLTTENPGPLASEKTILLESTNLSLLALQPAGFSSTLISWIPSVCKYQVISYNGLNYLDVNCFPGLTGQKLTKVPIDLSCRTIKLELLCNKLTHLPYEAFSAVGLVNLRHIGLNNNKISTLNEHAFKDLKELQYLCLKNNQITSLHSKTFRDNLELNTVVLSYNPITRLENELFANMPKLSIVEAEHCGLSHIGPKTFENSLNLSVLKLNNNNLVQFNFPGLTQQTRLVLFLARNRWNCDCELKFLRDEASKINDSPICIAPETNAGKLLKSLDPEDFGC